MTNIKAIIFDLDGTLVNTLNSLQKSCNLALADYGLRALTLEEVRKFVGYGAKVFVYKAVQATAENLNSYEIESLSIKVFRSYMRVFAEYCTFEVAPYDGIIDLLYDLQKRNIKLTCLTNKPHQMALQVIHKCFGDLDLEFSVIQGQENDKPKKPSLDSVLPIIEQLKCNINEAVMIGDGDTDVQTAINCKMPGIAVSWGFRSFAELKKAGAKIIVDQPKDILRYI